MAIIGQQDAEQWLYYLLSEAFPRQLICCTNNCLDKQGGLKGIAGTSRCGGIDPAFWLGAELEFSFAVQRCALTIVSAQPETGQLHATQRLLSCRALVHSDTANINFHRFFLRALRAALRFALRFIFCLTVTVGSGGFHPGGII